MRIVENQGTDRVVDVLSAVLAKGLSLDLATPQLSLFAFAALAAELNRVDGARLVLPDSDRDALALLGTEADRAARNQLQARWLASRLSRWIEQKAELRASRGAIPQASVVLRDREGARLSLVGNCQLSTEGLGLSPSPDFALVHASESPSEAAALSKRFTQVWNGLAQDPTFKPRLLAAIEDFATPPAPALVYQRILLALFEGVGEDLDEDRVIKSGTGIRESTVWKKLYRFQRDGVIGAIDKLERFGGCIIADSVGLGKTFEALAVIKYYELRNDRVLVLAPKRLRENWTVYRLNDRRNPLLADRLNFDVLNHTDLSREAGHSGDIDLAHVNWGNYDLVVIDESHNFRNNPATNDRVTRYQHLMQRIVQAGVRTRVLMLSATPVNNRLADLRNQIAFATEGRDDALSPHGIDSIETTCRVAQTQFNRWLQLHDDVRTPERLVDMLGFDYFRLLDLLTIARSRDHVVRYYGTKETGQFPERLRPQNLKADIDLADRLVSVREINEEILRLNLATYTPLKYVLPNKREAYQEHYRTRVRGGASSFDQLDREQSLIHLLRVNVLKRLESSVHSFGLTLQRLLDLVNELLERLDEHESGGAHQAPSVEDLDFNDDILDATGIGRSVKVLLADVDRVRWRHELRQDRERLAGLLQSTRRVGPERDAKLAALKELIAAKLAQPINEGNRKLLVFTAFADTASYLYAQLHPWLQAEFGLHSGLITGSGANRSTLPGLGHDMHVMLTAFSPVSKQRPADEAALPELDLLIATDCISEGQNLQDCDTLVNYDIHWNPVRIVQRFGRIDRLGSKNARIQLVNFWPNLELEEYINLEQRVSGRMVLLDVSATGEENIIQRSSGDPMNDLEYRRRQLLKLQEEVIDLEDLSGGVAITDLTLTDFRLDLARGLQAHRDQIESMPLGTHAVVRSLSLEGHRVPAGTIFCLRAETDRARASVPPGYPLSAHFLVHVSADGEVLLPLTHAKAILDHLRLACADAPLPDPAAWASHDAETRQGRDMQQCATHLAAAVGSIVGVEEERAIQSLFSPSGTHSLPGEFPGMNDFEVLAFVRVLPDEGSP